MYGLLNMSTSELRHAARRARDVGAPATAERLRREIGRRILAVRHEDMCHAA